MRDFEEKTQFGVMRTSWLSTTSYGVKNHFASKHLGMPKGPPITDPLVSCRFLWLIFWQVSIRISHIDGMFTPSDCCVLQFLERTDASVSRIHLPLAPAASRLLPFEVCNIPYDVVRLPSLTRSSLDLNLDVPRG